MDPSNSLDWCYAILSLTFVIPVMLNVEGSLHWQAGAMAVLNSWVGLLLYLQRCCPILNFSFSNVCNPLSCIFSFPFRFEGVGIYVVMLWEILRTLFRVVMLFGFLMIAFSLAFYALLLNQVGKPGRVLGWSCHDCCIKVVLCTQKEFQTVPLSVMQTFVMMVGELNYQNNILDPYLKDELPFTVLTYMVLVNFIVVMPILLVNLMVSVSLTEVYLHCIPFPF